MYDSEGFIAQIIPSDRDDWPNPSAEQDILLIADAPLLLEEVKRLREAIEYAIVHAENHDVIRVLDVLDEVKE